MSERIEKMIMWAMFFVAIVISLTPCWYWFVNPELTRMQVFKEWWYVELGAIIIASIPYFCFSSKEKK